MKCPRCGHDNPEVHQFCAGCGKSLSVSIASVAGTRRYDIDTIRVIALALLILYHIAVGFQPWGIYISFITNEQPLEELWRLMEVMNIWRIPILFVVSGMGVCFAMERRDWKQLIGDRTMRIAIPYIFGFYFIVPIYLIIFNSYYDRPLFYMPNPGHLWFLSNIFLYVLALLPLFHYFINHPDNIVFRLVSYVIRKPLGVIFIFASPLVIEAVLVNPDTYAAFALDPIHGLLVGMICFLVGFVFVSLKGQFWDAVKKVKLVALVLGLSLYLVRVDILAPSLDGTLLAPIESTSWMLSAFGFGAAYLNRPSNLLAYLSSAVYPAYIVHMPVQFFSATIIFPLSAPAFVKFMLVLMTTYIGSLLIFEIVKRFKWIRFLFGMKI